MTRSPEPFCSNCRHFNPVCVEPNEATYGNCRLDEQLVVRGDCYCDEWEDDPLTRSPLDRESIPDREKESIPDVLTLRIPLSAEDTFALERDKRALATLDRIEVEAYAIQKAETALEYRTIAFWLLALPGIRPLIDAHLEEPDEHP